uniref:hypothetical protein n=1 Tax=Actinomyces culturomici TaxID=1926276 RepID=UPI001F2FBE56|nr:hypothetical protein [Actinomyces culturomici]
MGDDRLAAESARPSPRLRLARRYSLIALGANALTGGNYFYQRDMPVMGFVGQPWYWLGTLALGYAINWAAYGVSQLVDRRDSPVASTPAVLVA